MATKKTLTKKQLEKQMKKAQESMKEKELAIEARVAAFRKDIKAVVDAHGMDFYAVLVPSMSALTASMRIMRTPARAGDQPREIETFLTE